MWNCFQSFGDLHYDKMTPVKGQQNTCQNIAWTCLYLVSSTYLKASTKILGNNGFIFYYHSVLRIQVLTLAI